MARIINPVLEKLVVLFNDGAREMSRKPDVLPAVGAQCQRAGFVRGRF
jgi:hypothetical protein